MRDYKSLLNFIQALIQQTSNCVHNERIDKSLQWALANIRLHYHTLQTELVVYISGCFVVFV